MNNAKQVGWIVLDPQKQNITLPPEKLKTSDLGFDGTIKYCPSFFEFYKNIFAIKAVTDLLIRVHDYDELDVKSSIEENSLQRFVRVNNTDRNKSRLPVIQLLQDHNWVSDDENVWLETLPPILHMHQYSWSSNIRYINGAIDIYSWPRAVNVAFEIVNIPCEVNIKKGDVIQYVRIIDKNNYQTSFELKDLTGLPNTIFKNNDIKNKLTMQPQKRFSINWKSVFGRAKDLRKDIKFLEGK